jgi:hypothetical protein
MAKFRNCSFKKLAKMTITALVMAVVLWIAPITAVADEKIGIEPFHFVRPPFKRSLECRDYDAEAFFGIFFYHFCRLILT